MKKYVLIAAMATLVTTAAGATILNIDAQRRIASELGTIRSNAASCKARMDASITRMNKLKTDYSSQVDPADGANLQAVLNAITTVSNNAATVVTGIDANFPTIKE